MSRPNTGSVVPNGVWYAACSATFHNVFAPAPTNSPTAMAIGKVSRRSMAETSTDETSTPVRSITRTASDTSPRVASLRLRWTRPPLTTATPPNSSSRVTSVRVNRTSKPISWNHQKSTSIPVAWGMITSANRATRATSKAGSVLYFNRYESVAASGHPHSGYPRGASGTTPNRPRLAGRLRRPVRAGDHSPGHRDAGGLLVVPRDWLRGPVHPHARHPAAAVWRGGCRQRRPRPSQPQAGHSRRGVRCGAGDAAHRRGRFIRRRLGHAAPAHLADRHRRRAVRWRGREHVVECGAAGGVPDAVRHHRPRVRARHRLLRLHAARAFGGARRVLQPDRADPAAARRRVLLPRRDRAAAEAAAHRTGGGYAPGHRAGRDVRALGAAALVRRHR